MLLVLLLAAPAPAQTGDKLTLRCTGWQPVYRTWEQPAAQPREPGAPFLVQIDRNANTVATTLPNAGEVMAELESNQSYYSAMIPLGRMVFNRSLDAVEISINRASGESRFRYMVGETGYPAFSGTCVPTQPL